MQQTIAQQLGLSVGTVSNFFMNARRRSVDKWVSDGVAILAVSNSGVTSNCLQSASRRVLKKARSHAKRHRPSTTTTTSLPPIPSSIDCAVDSVVQSCIDDARDAALNQQYAAQVDDDDDETSPFEQLVAPMQITDVSKL